MHKKKLVCKVSVLSLKRLIKSCFILYFKAFSLLSLIILSGVAGLANAGDDTVYWIKCDAENPLQGSGSREYPFGSIERANDVLANPQNETPYSTLIFAAGTKCVTKEALVLNHPGVVVKREGYGENQLPDAPWVILDLGRQRHGDPAIRVEAAGVKIYGLHLNVKNPDYIECDSSEHHDVELVTLGSRVGVEVMDGAKDVVIEGAYITGFYAGVFLKSNGGNVRSSYLHGNRMMNVREGNDDDAGAMGVLIWGQHNSVSHNYFRNNSSCTHDYGLDGASVELFSAYGRGASHNQIYGNWVENDQTFVEMGDEEGALPLVSTTITHNTYISDLWGSSFIVLRGSGDSGFGHVGASNTDIHSNTSSTTGIDSNGIVCEGSGYLENNTCYTAIKNLQSLFENNTVCAENNAGWIGDSDMRHTALLYKNHCSQ